MTLAALVVGGGPGGLAAAHALMQLGWNVDLVERHQTASSGVALTLWPNGLAALDMLGLRERVENQATLQQGIGMTDDAGKKLSLVRSSRLRSAFGGSGIAIRRSQLLEALTPTSERFTYHRGVEFKALHESIPKPTVTLSSGIKEFDLVVGADGANSRVARELGLLPGARSMGMAVIRGISSMRPAAQHAEMRLGRGRQFGIFSLGSDGTYWFASNPVSSTQGVSCSLGPFESWAAPVPNLIEATAPGLMNTTRVFDRGLRTAPWGRGCVTLLGDAAHVSAPTLGQGTCHAFEDAAVLMQAMSRTRVDLSDRLRCYEQFRAPRVNSHIKQSARMARMARIDSSFLVFLRNQSMRLTPESMQLNSMSSMFKFDSLP